MKTISFIIHSLYIFVDKMDPKKCIFQKTFSKSEIFNSCELGMRSLYYATYNN